MQSKFMAMRITAPKFTKTILSTDEMSEPEPEQVIPGAVCARSGKSFEAIDAVFQEAKREPRGR